jgi:hypothetical protein
MGAGYDKAGKSKRRPNAFCLGFVHFGISIAPFDAFCS